MYFCIFNSKHRLVAFNIYGKNIKSNNYCCKAGLTAAEGIEGRQLFNYL